MQFNYIPRIQQNTPNKCSLKINIPHMELWQFLLFLRIHFEVGTTEEWNLSSLIIVCIYPFSSVSSVGFLSEKALCLTGSTSFPSQTKRIGQIRINKVNLY